MAKRRRITRSKRDLIEQAMEDALGPEHFVDYNASWDFVSGLEEVAGEIDSLVGEDPEQAADLYETFVAGCNEKAEEVDDSGGNLGMFVDDLFRGWIKARQAMKADPDETATFLLDWMDDDPYGFAYELERDAVKVLHKKGLAALASAIRERFAAAVAAAADEGGEERAAGVASWPRRRWGAALKTIYGAQRDIGAYVALCEETELLPVDCEVIAVILRSRRKPEDALEWVDRGLQLGKEIQYGSGSSYKLADMRRALLKRLGRGDEAIESAWAEYKARPDIYTYKELMKNLPKAKRAAWHERAMEASAEASLRSVIELWLEKKELARLVDRLRETTDDELESLSHYTTEPAAKKLKRNHPEIAARLFRAVGMRIVNAKKSKYYGAALDNLGNAKWCYEKAGMDDAWAALVAEVRKHHHRKYGFMPGFERLAAGSGPQGRNEPSFLERAKRRQRQRQRRGRASRR